MDTHLFVIRSSFLPVNSSDVYLTASFVRLLTSLPKLELHGSDKLRCMIVIVRSTILYLFRGSFEIGIDYEWNWKLFVEIVGF